MELSSEDRQNFDLRIKNKLFESFRRSKRNDLLSEKQNDLVITPAGSQFLQGNITSMNQLNKFNRILFDYLKENTLHFMFTEKYMKEKPFRFFEETINIFLNNEINPQQYFDNSYDNIVIFKQSSLYVFNTFGTEWSPHVFELIIIDEAKNVNQKECFLWIFTLIYKLGFASYIGDNWLFEQFMAEESDWWSDLDEEDEKEMKQKKEIYVSQNALHYFKQIKRKSVRSNSFIISQIEKYGKEDEFINPFANEIIDLFLKVDITNLKFFHRFQQLEECRTAINDSGNHISEFNLFTYDLENEFEEQFAMMADEIIGNLDYVPYFAPIEIDSKGNIHNYNNDLDSVSLLLGKINDLIFKSYQQWKK